jgi:hypothetical protein
MRESAEERRQNMRKCKTKDNDNAEFIQGWAVENRCENCGATEGIIEQIWTDDGTKPLLCEDYAEEVRRLEKLADEWAMLPSCQEREQILDTAETTAGLVNRLRAHDMAECAACAKKTGFGNSRCRKSYYQKQAFCRSARRAFRAF